MKQSIRRNLKKNGILTKEGHIIPETELKKNLSIEFNQNMKKKYNEMAMRDLTPQYMKEKIEGQRNSFL